MWWQPYGDFVKDLLPLLIIVALMLLALAAAARAVATHWHYSKSRHRWRYRRGGQAEREFNAELHQYLREVESRAL